VGFRYFVLDKALALGLTGYARNCSGGDVMVIAEGEISDLDILVDFLKIGPSRARVEDVTIARSPWTGNFNGFTISH
jgi:acylphosphatase